jgi:hypothetical protein
MTIRRAAFGFLVVLLVASRADAQFQSDKGAGEQYHVEFTLRFWSPTPQMQLSTGSLANLGIGPVDFVQEFGIEKERFTEYSVISKAGKHKVRYSSIPISYTKEAVVTRTIQFGGLTVPVTAPVSTEVDWRLRRYGYEWDFVAGDRGYLGMLTDVKDNKFTANITAGPYGSQDADVRVWVPTIGVGARAYPHRLISVTGEFGVELTRFKGFDRLKTDWDGHYADWDIYGTGNLGRNVGVQVGYRSIHVDYESDSDSADLKMKGLYFGGNLRF